MPKGTVLMSCVGQFGLICIAETEVVPNQQLHGFICLDKVLPEYVAYALMTQVEQMNQLASATTIAYINKTKCNSIQIPLAPINEQKRIVAEIESLRERSQKARSALAPIPELCDKFRQSVLAAAFRGDLTADWREQNPDVEPASVLLERIRDKRLVEAKTDKQKKSLEEIYSHEEEHGFEPIPEDWKYTALEKLCYAFQYGTSAKSLPEGKIPVLRMGNLQAGEIDWQDLAYTNDDDEISKYILKPGDILFNRTNSPELVGKTSIYRGERPAIFAGYLIKIDNSPELDSEYLNYCLNTRYAKDYCWKVKTDGVSQSNINAQKLAKFEVPLCSLQEQQEIVRQIRSLSKAVSQIEQQYQWVESYLNQLDRSILAKAFRGELVEQDPNDEPASVLLERIRAEREQKARGKAKKPGKKGQRTIKAE
jgi:type I restriction enzyme S subunit